MMRNRSGIKLNHIEPNLSSKLDSKEKEQLINDFKKSVDEKEIKEFLFPKSRFERSIFEETAYIIGSIKNIELINILKEEYTKTFLLKKKKKFQILII